MAALPIGIHFCFIPSNVKIDQNQQPMCQTKCQMRTSPSKLRDPISDWIEF